jgi:DNA-binding MarR family transcriptional regulator
MPAGAWRARAIGRADTSAGSNYEMSAVSHLSHPVCELADEIMRISGRIKIIFSEATSASGVSPLAYTVFVYVAESKSAPTVPQIGRSIGHARQVIQRAVNELIAAGLVETLPNPNHKRAPLLQLSPAGETFKLRSDERGIAIGDQVMRFVGESRCREVLEDLRAFRGEIEEYVRKEGSSA